MRPPTNEPVIIKRLLDIGFYNFLIPFVETEEQALRAVSSTRYPPAGIRGVLMSHRCNNYGTVPEYFSVINDNITVLTQIESQDGVDNVDAIAAVDGVDSIFVGPGDLSAALSSLGAPNHSEVQRVIQHIFARARVQGKPSGILGRRPKPMLGAIWNRARALSPSAAIWACFAARLSPCATNSKAERLALTAAPCQLHESRGCYDEDWIYWLGDHG